MNDKFNFQLVKESDFGKNTYTYQNKRCANVLF